jgi:hypothetical protein
VIDSPSDRSASASATHSFLHVEYLACDEKSRAIARLAYRVIKGFS